MLENTRPWLENKTNGGKNQKRKLLPESQEANWASMAWPSPKEEISKTCQLCDTAGLSLFHKDPEWGGIVRGHTILNVPSLSLNEGVLTDQHKCSPANNNIPHGAIFPRKEGQHIPWPATQLAAALEHLPGRGWGGLCGSHMHTLQILVISPSCVWVRLQ